MNEYKKVKAKILLVEDNAADIRLTKEVLQKGRIVSSLDVVRDGVEAIDFLKKNGKYSNVSTPNLILLDLNLPKRNGFEVLEEIKRDEELKRIPVVILTVSDTNEDLIKAYNLHANCYVIKPLELKEFYRIFRRILNIDKLKSNRAHADRYAGYFKEIMEKLMRGEWAVPYWWEDPDGIRHFEESLLRLGFVKPDNLDR